MPDDYQSPAVADDDSPEKLLKAHHDDEGDLAFSFEDDEISFETYTLPFELSDDSYMAVWFKIVNKSTSPMDFKSGEISVRMSRKEMGETVPIGAEILNGSEAEKALRAESEYLVKNSNEDFIMSNVAQAAFDAILGFDGTAIGALDRAITGVMAESSETEKEAQLKENENKLKEGMKRYLKSSQIAPGDTFETFITIRYKEKPRSFTVSLNLKGQTYSLKMK